MAALGDVDGEREFRSYLSVSLDVTQRYRVLQELERRIQSILRRAEGKRLTRHFVRDEIRIPIDDMLEDVRRRGRIHSFNVRMDMSDETIARGELALILDVSIMSRSEVLSLTIESLDTGSLLGVDP